MCYNEAILRNEIHKFYGKDFEFIIRFQLMLIFLIYAEEVKYRFYFVCMNKQIHLNDTIGKLFTVFLGEKLL